MSLRLQKLNCLPALPAYPKAASSEVLSAFSVGKKKVKKNLTMQLSRNLGSNKLSSYCVSEIPFGLS